MDAAKGAPPKGRRRILTGLSVERVAPGAIAPPPPVNGSITSPQVMFKPRSVAPVLPLQVRPAASTQKVKKPAIQLPSKILSIAEEPIKKTEEEVAVAEEVAPAPAEAAAEEVQQPQQKPTKTMKIRRPKYSAALKQVRTAISEIEHNNPYKEPPEAYAPPNRRGFIDFIIKTYRKDFALPPKLAKPDFEACSKLGAAGEDTAKMYLYQQFVREYIRQESPYRGMLVYHGLGSGKTCSAIAAMEALYGNSQKKIILMTPVSLQNNFLTEISFCGFKHFRLQNHWVRVELETDPTAALFAKNVLGIPDSFFEKQKRAKVEQAFYVPDFSQPPNFDTLQDNEKSAVREQIFATLRHRITFISYNGITARALKEIACYKPDFFDDAIIVIDEVHNMTRLMQGAIEPYLKETRAQRRIAAEPVTTERWKPKLCMDVDKNYKRAFLFYRLLCGAKNSKIIALSGTPLVNFPEELGILANVLHGYTNCAEASLPASSNKLDSKKIITIFKEVCAKHPRIDFFNISSQDTTQKIFISAVPEGYKKTFDATGTLKGFERIDDEDDIPRQDSIQEIFEDLTVQLRGYGINIASPVFQAIPLLPPDSDGFREKFIDLTSGLPKIANEITLKSRLTGLISYYRGSKEEFMPKVTRDEIIPVPFTEHSLLGYLKARKHEQKSEKEKKKSEGQDKTMAVWAEVLIIGKSKNPSSYRFRSRAACNFVFPDGIERPFSDDKADQAAELGKEGDILGDQEVDNMEDEAASIAAEKEDAELDEEDDEAPKEAVVKKDTKGLSYKERITIALDTIRANADKYLKIDSSDPTKPHLAMYSPKYAEIIRRINDSKGSALVYSQFKAFEGIGLFGIALEANGYIPIEILGSDADPYFSPRTEASFRAHFAGAMKEEDEDEEEEEDEDEDEDEEEEEDEDEDEEEEEEEEEAEDDAEEAEEDAEEDDAEDDAEEAEEEDTNPPTTTKAQTGGAPAKKRYILYSGEVSRERRNLYVNLFNARFDRLPSRIAAVLRESGFTGPTNKYGDICNVFCITGAGAEGLSLKNCRSVHIMEPFWNPVRTDQVKGRAVRICSHSELPLEERTVDVYTYYSVVSQQMIDQRLVDETFFNKDRGQTSDEFILTISNYKKKITEDLLSVMKASSIDCVLNYTENNTASETIKCFRILGAADEFMFDPRLDAQSFFKATTT
jgi:hypothetical protein